MKLMLLTFEIGGKIYRTRYFDLTRNSFMKYFCQLPENCPSQSLTPVSPINILYSEILDRS